jgi:hypothetical protein
MLSGDAASGIARFELDFAPPYSLYLKYEVQRNTDSPYDDLLTLEAFSTLEAATTAKFSDRAVLFRREPCAPRAQPCNG